MHGLTHECDDSIRSSMISRMKFFLLCWNTESWFNIVKKIFLSDKLRNQK